MCQHFDFTSLSSEARQVGILAAKCKAQWGFLNVWGNTTHSRGQWGGVWLQMRWGEGWRGTHSAPEVRWNDATESSMSSSWKRNCRLQAQISWQTDMSRCRGGVRISETFSSFWGLKYALCCTKCSELEQTKCRDSSMEACTQLGK